MINIETAIRILGEQYESAIEAMWEEWFWDEEVDMNEFLTKWTEWIELSTQFMTSMGDE